MKIVLMQHRLFNVMFLFFFCIKSKVDSFYALLDVQSFATESNSKII